MTCRDFSQARLLSALRGCMMVMTAVLALAAFPARSEPRGADYFTNLPLVTSAGEEVKFFDDVLADRIVVVNFFYTSCTDLCSLSISQWRLFA